MNFRLCQYMKFWRYFTSCIRPKTTDAKNMTKLYYASADNVFKSLWIRQYIVEHYVCETAFFPLDCSAFVRYARRWVQMILTYLLTHRTKPERQLHSTTFVHLSASEWRNLRSHRRFYKEANSVVKCCWFRWTASCSDNVFRSKITGYSIA